MGQSSATINPIILPTGCASAIQLQLENGKTSDALEISISQPLSMLPPEKTTSIHTEVSTTVERGGKQKQVEVTGSFD
jgi:hypothetical protein